MTSALSASVIAGIDDLEVAARLVVEGLKSGAHRSPFHGFSAEFQQHRPYRAGDDLKYLDWKILARTNRLYSRQFRETTNMAVMLVIDSSGSMAFPSESHWSKFRYASVLAASLAYLIAQQGDAVGLMSMQNDKLSYLPARGGRLHLRSVVAHLDRLEPRGAWDAERVIARGAELLRRRGVVLVISDFYDAEDETRRAMRRVAHNGHDVGMIQIVSQEERTFPYTRATEFEDLESGQRRVIDATAAVANYSTAFRGFLDRCRSAAHRDGLDYVLAATDEAPEHVLRKYLLARSAGHRTGQVGAQT